MFLIPHAPVHEPRHPPIPQAPAPHEPPRPPVPDAAVRGPSRSPLSRAVRPLAPGEDAALAAALAEALVEEPFVGWLCQGDRARAEAFLRLGLERFAGPPGAALVAREAAGGRIVGGLLLAGPGALPPSPPASLAMLPGLARAARPHRLPRAIAALARLDRAHPPEPHWSGLALGVIPAYRGRGHGAALIEAARAIVDADPRPVHLETAGAVNEARYRRHGFAVSGRVAVPGGPTVTTMIRPATRQEQP